MVNADDISWGSYDAYEGPYFRGIGPYAFPAALNDDEKFLKVVTSTEGGSPSAINAYDRCKVSVGLLQWCEAGMYGVSDMLGFLVEQGVKLTALEPALEQASAEFRKNRKGRYRFFTMSADEVDTAPEQNELFFLRSDGTKGSWDDESRHYARVWAACFANLFSAPDAIQAQVRYTAPKLRGFTMKDVVPILWGKDQPQGNDGWVGALRAAYLSFAANLPAVAGKHFMIAHRTSRNAQWTKEWVLDVLRELTFGPGIGIYPHRYNAIRPVIEQIYGVDLPDFAKDLGWRVPEEIAKYNLDTPKGVQSALIALGYDLGPKGADGSIGPKTTTAIRTFQRLNGLVSDGIAGNKTLMALSSALTALQGT